MSGPRTAWASAFLMCASHFGCSDEGGGKSSPLLDGGADGAPDGGAVVALDPRSIPQFTEPLLVPTVMPPERTSNGVLEYEISARQFEQQMLPNGMPKTTVWGYGRKADPGTFHTPAFTFEVRSDPILRCIRSGIRRCSATS